MTYLSYPTAFLPPVVTVHPATAAAVSPLSVIESISLSSSTQLVVTASAADVQGSSQVFEAVAPDASFFVGIGSVVLLCIVAGSVWANDVVPISRAKLAISKSRGEVKEYLDDLKTDNDTSVDDLDAATMISDNQDESVENVKRNEGDGRGFERWLFSDWLNKPASKGGRQKEPALPILKDAKWNSGDNPVLVTAAIMMLGVVLASITERIAT